MYTVGIDLDDVLFNTLETAWLPFFNNKFGTNLKAKDITEWDITKFVPTHLEREIYQMLEAPKLWDMVKMVDGADTFLQELQKDKGINLFIVTSTSIFTTKAKWKKFTKLFPFIDYKQIITIHDKSLLKLDCLLDDNYNNLISGNYKKILYNRPHNDCGYIQKDIFRVYDLDEAYKLIQLFKGEKK